MQRQLQDAIKSKYGVSKKTSGQVIQALTEIEKNRQRASVGIPSRPGSEQQPQVSKAASDDEIPNIESIVGGLLSGGFSAQGGGILGLILGLLAKVFGMGGGSSQAQSSQNVTNILSDLTGGATHPSQAPDLASMLTSLLGSGGAPSGTSSQNADIEGLVTSLMSGAKKPPSRR